MEDQERWRALPQEEQQEQESQLSQNGAAPFWHSHHPAESPPCHSFSSGAGFPVQQLRMLHCPSLLPKQSTPEFSMTVSISWQSRAGNHNTTHALRQFSVRHSA